MLELDRTYVMIYQDGLRAEAAANRLARSSPNRGFADRRRLTGLARPRLSARAASLLVLVVALSVAAASPVLAEQAMHPPEPPAPALVSSPTPNPAARASSATSSSTSLGSSSRISYPAEYSDSYWKQCDLAGVSSDRCWLSVMVNQIALHEAWRR